jgi:hypothetical protein
MNNMNEIVELLFKFEWIFDKKLII